MKPAMTTCICGHPRLDHDRFVGVCDARDCPCGQFIDQHDYDYGDEATADPTQAEIPLGDRRIPEDPSQGSAR